jgi:sigma-E factor negative regulatory protein RseB
MAMVGGEGHARPTRSPRLLGAFVVAAGALFSAAVSAQDAGARADTARSEVQWIQAVRQAAQRVNYSGTVVYEAGGEMRSSRITHLFDGTHSIERIQTLDGRPREFVRRRSATSDEVQCFLPEKRRIRIERRAAEESFPALSSASPEEILDSYRMTIGGLDRVAGVECQTLVLQPKDDARFGYRLWVDRATGLLLKAQTLNERNEVVEQIAFSDIRIGERIDRSKVKPSWSTEGWSVERSDYRATDLAAQGWHVPAPNGFRKSREVVRKMGGADAMQVVLTDGLATLSVFIEPKSPQKAASDHVRTQGPTSAYSRRIGDSLVTVVGEVPPGTIRAVAEAVEFRGTR